MAVTLVSNLKGLRGSIAGHRDVTMMTGSRSKCHLVICISQHNEAAFMRSQPGPEWIYSFFSALIKGVIGGMDLNIFNSKQKKSYKKYRPPIFYRLFFI